jgi:hypothetical protein
MNSTIKIASNVAVELNQSNENSDTKKEDIQYLRERQRKSFKRNWKSKVMRGQ